MVMVVSAHTNQWPILSSLATTILDGPFSPSCAPRQGTSAKHAGRCVFGTSGSSSSTSVMDSRPTARSATGTATWGRGVSFLETGLVREERTSRRYECRTVVSAVRRRTTPGWWPGQTCSWTIAIRSLREHVLGPVHVDDYPSRRIACSPRRSPRSGTGGS